MQKPHAKRSRLISDFGTQGVVVRKVVLQWTIFTFASVLITGLIQFCAEPFAGIQSNLGKTLRLSMPVLLTMICLGPVFVYDFLKLSNRIFGPVPRIQSAIQELQSGVNVKPLAARDGDVQSSLIDDVNSLIDLISEARKSKDTEQTGVVEPSEESDSDLVGELKRLREAVSKLTNVTEESAEEPAAEIA